MSPPTSTKNLDGKIVGRPFLGSEADDPAHARCEGTDRQDPEGTWAFLHHPCKGWLDVIWALGCYRGERQAKPSGLTLHLRLTNGSETGESRVQHDRDPH